MEGTLALLLLVGDHDTVHDAGVTLDGMVASLAAAEGLKLIFDQPRPRDPSAGDGFPSSHATTAFAFARGLSDWRSDWNIPVYAFAAGVGWARVEEGYHTVEQVLAGAALGLWIAGASAESDGFVIQRSADPAAAKLSGEAGDEAEEFGRGPTVLLWKRAW
jgi:membrane-associated phospholipid phosphatase